MAKRPRVLVDTGVIISAINSSSGAPALVIEMGRGSERALNLLITPYIAAEVDAVLKRKFPKLVNKWAQLQKEKVLQTKDSPTSSQVQEARHLIKDIADVPIIAAAILHRVDYIVTVDRKHFLENDRLRDQQHCRTVHPTALVAEYLQRTR